MSAAVLRLRDRLDRTLLDRIAERALAVALAVPVLLLLALLMGLLFGSTVKAEEDLACGARDLVGELKLSNPAEYAKLKAEGDKIKNNGVRFWKLEKAGQEPNWLLGTMHLSDPRVTELPPEAQQAFDDADVIVLESDEILDQQKAAAKLMAKPELMYFSGTEKITDYLKPEEKALLEEGLLKRGLPLAAIAKMKPWIVTSMVALPTCELSRKAGGMPFLDMKLAQEGLKAGKEVRGVETLAEQIEAMASLPMSFHVKSLVSAVKYPDYTANMMETMLQLYREGDIGLVLSSAVYFAPEKDGEDIKGLEQFEDKLIRLRNHHMADRGAPILAQGNVFMAVGALHLVGDEGVVELLRQKGYTATAVK